MKSILLKAGLFIFVGGVILSGAFAIAGTETTNLNLNKPYKNETGWATKINGNFDTLDTAVGTNLEADGDFKTGVIDITNIKTGSKSGLDLNLITGTAGNADECAEWDANGDLVSAGAACGTGGGGGASELSDLSDIGVSLPTAGNILVGDGVDFDSVAMSGDCTVNGSGVMSCTASGSLLFTDGGAITYLTSTTDDLTVGGTTSAAALFVDVSGPTTTINGTLNTTGISSIGGLSVMNGDVGLGTLSPTETLDVVGNGLFSGSLTAVSVSTTNNSDPAITFDVNTTGDRDYVLAACSDNDGSADNSDNIQFGLGLTKCTSQIMKLRSDGDLFIGDDSTTNLDFYFLTQATTYDPLITAATAGTGAGFLSVTNVGAGGDDTSRAGFSVTADFDDGFTGTPYKAGIHGRVNYNGNSVNGLGVGSQGFVDMDNTTGTAGIAYGIRGYGSHTEAGTTAEFYGGYFQVGAINAGAITRNYGIGTTGRILYVPDEDTIADSGDGNPATATLNPTSSVVELTCSDANDCTITLGETGVLQGTPVYITNVSANVCNFADTSAVSELAGAFAMGQYDSLEILYIGDRWIEVGRSNN